MKGNQSFWRWYARTLFQWARLRWLREAMVEHVLATTGLGLFLTLGIFLGFKVNEGFFLLLVGALVCLTGAFHAYWRSFVRGRG